MPDGLGLDGPALGGDAENVAGQLGDFLLLPRPDHADHIPDILLGNGLPPAGEGQESLDGLAGQGHVLRLALHPELALPVDNGDGELLLQKADVLVKGPEEVHGLFQPLDADSLFQCVHSRIYAGLSPFLLPYKWGPSAQSPPGTPPTA